MAIVRGGVRVNKHPSSSVQPSRGQSIRLAEKGAALSDDSTDSDTPEDADSEVCQVGENVCSVPLELFDLPDLKSILSLETWNFVLTEEDRESLVGFLPNLDENAYRHTLKELFSGNDFHFSSPLADLHELLKAGLCHPQAVRYQEVLRCLQRKEHYHHVRQYHNQMVNHCLEMESLWQSYPDTTMEEKMEIWNSHKLKKASQFSDGSLRKGVGIFRTSRVQSLLNRKAKAQQKSIEMAKAANFVSNPARGSAMAEVDLKGAEEIKTDRKLKKKVKSDLNTTIVFEKPAGKLKRAQPTGVLRKLHNTSDTKMEAGNPQVLPSVVSQTETAEFPVSFPPVEEDFMTSEKVKNCSDRYLPAALPVEAPPVSSKIRAEKKPKDTEKKPKDVGDKQEQVLHPRDKFEEGLHAGNMDQQSLHVGDEGEQGLDNVETTDIVFGNNRKRKKDIDSNDITSIMAKDELDFVEGFSLDDPMENDLDIIEDPLLDVEEIQKDSYFVENSMVDELKKNTKRRVKVKEQVSTEESKPPSFARTECSDDLFAGGDSGVMDAVIDSRDEVAVDGTSEKPVKRRKKRVNSTENGLQSQLHTADGEPTPDSVRSKGAKKPASSPVPPVALSFPFSVIHLLSSVRMALVTCTGEQANALPPLHMESMITENASNDGAFLMSPESICFQSNGQSLQCEDGDIVKEPEDRRCGLPAVPLQVIVLRVQQNPGDPRILETKEPLQGLVRGVLKVLSSKTTQPVMKGWKPFVTYEKEARGWSWIGPVPSMSVNGDATEVQVSADAWAVPQKMLYKLQEVFGNWLKHEQEILQRLGQLSLPPPPLTPILDEKERFRELRAQKSLITINPTSEEMRAYFRREEALRYSVPDRAFSYTSVDGRKSAVAPLRRIGGKPTSKARDHFMLKSDRPPHVTILCLVRDAAARLPGSIGTRADVCALIRDSQYIVEDVSDAQLNQVVSGALDRLHYERDPCVRFDGDRKLWVYLHTDKDEEDFEDDATSSTKRWKRTKKEGAMENTDFPFVGQEYDYAGRDDQDPCGLGLDFSPSSCFGGPGDLYSSSGRAELVYTQNGSLASPHMIGSTYPGQVRDDNVLPFIELPPSIQPPCVNMQQSHPMGWEVLGNRWEHDTHFQPHDHIVQDFDAVAAITATHRESEIMMDRSMP